MGGLYSYKKEIAHFIFRKPIDIAFRKATIRADDVRVILICSSFGEYALSNPDKLSEEMLERHGAHYSFVKVSRNGAELDDFTGNNYLVDQIIANDPDYVILQESHVFFEPEKRSFSITDLGLNEFRLVTYLRGLFLGFEKVYGFEAGNNPIQFDSKFDSTAQHFISPGQLREDNESWKNFANAITARKIILNVPLPIPLERRMDSIRNTMKYKKILAQNNAAATFDVFRGSHQFPYRYYRDGAHLNQAGEQKFSEWFLDELHQFHIQNKLLEK